MLPVLPTSHSIVQQQQNHHLVDNSRGSSRQSPTPSSPNKRSSSMIFRIEHLLPQTANTTVPGSSSSPTAAPTSPAAATREKNGSPSASSSPKKSKIIRAGVHVTQLIPKDTTSILIDSHALLTASHPEMANNEPLARAYCSLSPKGDVLILNASIMRKIKLSEDIHSYNALFELHNGQVQLRVVRDVQRDEEIVAWFGEELTLLMAIPFLTPLNIQGNNRYMCHWCHLTFETPNPLKIHLALGCGRHNIDVLWIRLHYALKAKQYSQQLFTLPLVGNATTARSSPHMISSGSTTTTTTTANISVPQSSTSSMRSLSPSYSPPGPAQTSCSSPPPRFSAFKPISLATPAGGRANAPHPATSLPVSLATALSGQPHLHTSTPAPHMSFLPTFSTAGFPHMSLLHPPPSTNPLNAAAQIEAIVSNMGASKQGHLCIYCGKMYSRKYGLKIHIRTHTGFKPLKCKYCLRPFGDPSNLNKHIRLHLQTSSSGHGGQGTPGSEVYQCTLCHKTFARRRDLQKHVENRHGEAHAAESKMETGHTD
uniref:C2H2-type domain-containing protein n=1 Tax=Musca domestica TaxID=7370 RepID=A0A1I8N3B5_MUSDO